MKLRNAWVTDDVNPNGAESVRLEIEIGDNSGLRFATLRVNVPHPCTNRELVSALVELAVQAHEKRNADEPTFSWRALRYELLARIRSVLR